MSLPDSRDQTFLPGSVLPSATANALQDQEVLLWRALRGGDLVDFDEFLGDTVNRGRWVNPPTAFTLVDDAAAGGFGAGRLQTTGADKSVEQLPLPLALLNFRVSTRMRLQIDPIETLAVYTWGLRSATAGEELYFKITPNGPSPGTSTWKAVVGAAAPVDLAVAADNVYHFFEIRREPGIVRFLIDGVERYSTNFGVNVAAAKVKAAITVNTDPGTLTLFMDHVKVWASRFPLSTDGGPPVDAHRERGLVAFTGAEDYIDVAFTANFSSGNAYTFSATASPDDESTGAISVDILNRATNGMRLRPSARFTGKVSWSAEALP